ncbi:hypothetical protein PR002_g12193 [Phytophthora rubi]|uniref:Uncharacterized protein n=1 Tax=Phytophthora rubi TaxID=129364 RepID=A0A6A3LTZ0_9STRA|nr:hypothetical protein PR002_g12193 [Phytophthora rubi]
MKQEIGQVRGGAMETQTSMSLRASVLLLRRLL